MRRSSIYYTFMTVLATSAVIAACAAVDPEAQSDAKLMTVGAGTPVPAAAETQAVATEAADAADDPEIWADPNDPSRGVIFGSDKKAGLYVYDFDGKVRAFLPEGPLNNVDLRDGFQVGGRPQVLVAASDRARGGAALFLLDPADLSVKSWGLVPVPVSEPYGLCMSRRGDTFNVIVVGIKGDVIEVRVEDAGGKPRGTEVRRFNIGSQAEGCVVDETGGALYVGEEAKGVWRYPADPAAGIARTLLAPAPSEMLKPDVEGLTLMRDGDRRFLIASSQGDSAFAVWRVDGAAPAYAGRFSVVAANGVDAVTGTDGVAALGGRVGPYPEGLIVVQDDIDSDGEGPSTTRARQNFKLVDWREVKKALGL